jgi:hypothetical protein
MGDKVSYLFQIYIKTLGKIISLYISTSVSLHSKCEDKIFWPEWQHGLPELNLPSIVYEKKSLNNRNFILKLVEKYSQRKILFRDTKWLLSNTPYWGRDDRAVWACAIARTTWPLHCQLATGKSKDALFVFCGQRV